jgi:hypothetical protein
MGDIVPRKEVEREGIRGFASIAGGGALLLLSALPVAIGVIGGGALALVGFGIAGSKKDRLAGGVAATAGIVTVLAKLGIFGGGLLWLGGVGLLGFGAWSLYNFFRKLKTRS